MTTANQLKKEIQIGLETILERYQEKSELIQAEETHGEPLNERFIDDKIVALEKVLDALEDVLDDLSYIE